MSRTPVLLLTHDPTPSALEAGLHRRGLAVEVTRDGTLAAHDPRPVIVAPDWARRGRPAGRQAPWVELAPDSSLQAQLQQVLGVVHAPSSDAEALGGPSQLAMSASPEVDPFATLDADLGPHSHRPTEEPTTESIVAQRPVPGADGAPHTDPHETVDLDGYDSGRETLDNFEALPSAIESGGFATFLPSDMDAGAPVVPPPPGSEGPAGPTARAHEASQTQSGWLNGENTLDDPLHVSINPTRFTRGTPDSDPDLIAGRYERVGTLGRGGMGEVWSVRDRALQCVMAMKVIRPEVIGSREVVSRFIGEAQATAQLQHPGIVPVHELGSLPDGRLFFTMQLVQGRTLRSVTRALHADSLAQGQWGVGHGFSLRRLLSAMLQATQAVAYAHARGVLHRDLKPENLMLGDFGEVRVLDWGLARTQSVLEGATEELTGDPESLADLSPLAYLNSGQTRMGQVAGTPAFMAPEQAWGRIDQFGPHTDVYALGACLYALLTGHAPHRGNAQQALASARRGQHRRVRPAFEVDPHLVALVEACLHPEPEQRPPHAGTLARQLSDWLDGARRRDLALEQVAMADQRAARLKELHGERAEAERALEARKKVVVDHINEQIRRGTPSPAPLPTVEAQWAAEDHLAAVQREEALAEVRTLQALRSALMQVPDLPEAHARLADHHRARFDEAVAREDLQGSIVQEALVREHALDTRHDRWLANRGTLRLQCTASHATARVLRCEEEDRRLVPRPLPAPFGAPVPFPLDLDLPAGSYVLEVDAPGHTTVRYPALVPREGVWDAVPPEGGAPQPLALPREDEVPPDGHFVPAGWAWVGGRGASRRRSTIPWQRVWIDAFWAEPHPVTNRRYLAFLDALVAAGREEDALAHVPRYRSKAGTIGEMVYGRRTDGGFALVPDADGDLWHPDWPVFLVTWAGARAFAAWWAEESGWPWRLPSEHEWRKACGGVDGRLYPWGDAPVDHYANMRLGSPGPMLPEPVGSHPTDTSVYGVTGGAGGVMHWCADPYLTTGTPVSPTGRSEPELAEPDAVHVCRGGTWTWATGDCTLDLRNHAQPTTVREWFGFRLVCAPRASMLA